MSSKSEVDDEPIQALPVPAEHRGVRQNPLFVIKLDIMLSPLTGIGLAVESTYSKTKFGQQFWPADFIWSAPTQFTPATAFLHVPAAGFAVESGNQVKPEQQGKTLNDKLLFSPSATQFETSSAHL